MGNLPVTIFTLIAAVWPTADHVNAAGCSDPKKSQTTFLLQLFRISR